jgi:hypothetical protein
MKLTRRDLAAALLAPAAAAQAQTTTPPGDEVEAARARLKTNADALAKVDVPMSTEPAFSFKA